MQILSLIQAIKIKIAEHIFLNLEIINLNTSNKND